MLRTALLYDDGPVALRYPRGEGAGVLVPAAEDLVPIEIGTGELLREATAAWPSSGRTGTGKALEAADLLAEAGISVTVADARSPSPSTSS
jgi:1-deoxy-D-xylulose-5-phosphate synthase